MKRRRAFVVTVSAASLLDCAERNPAQSAPGGEPVTTSSGDLPRPAVTATASEDQPPLEPRPPAVVPNTSRGQRR
jgi:hypothetical protein